jgi:hypothetical protein
MDTMIARPSVLYIAAIASAAGASPELTVRALYDAFNARDADALVAHVTDDVQWNTVAGQSITVETSGKSALRASMVRYFRSMPTVRSQIEGILPAGDFVTVHERVTWRRGDVEQTQSAVAVYKVREGRIAAVWYFEVMP